MGSALERNESSCKGEKREGKEKGKLEGRKEREREIERGFCIYTPQGPRQIGFICSIGRISGIKVQIEN